MACKRGGCTATRITLCFKVRWGEAMPVQHIVGKPPTLAVMHDMHVEDFAWYMAKFTPSFCFSSDTTTTHATDLDTLTNT
jgi:hypothetical protein